ncbi:MULTISPECIES: glycosyltransferase [unclassified Imperialibacter]|uniref:glycosyltransferase n=1 Tax=unclassified Imperialibacter TaxID=2629706 RepID=UPI00125205EA|nr:MULTISPECIES: glycosyltransferase [unclassified Imperialibacter]CAD5255173.1 putative glycosyl transferase from UDP-glucuronosyltransferase family [Imperialibacter sp. 75]CAD5263734.1 putative glycosyl transferase from UDP-glucuronosyltransferase family [Imperialibacter sp. 89]VVT35500.1 putative glycosyl transferase from UDP-glucuronosyltransferase family [Imperialibacter sp. EC-SDR9]
MIITVLFDPFPAFGHVNSMLSIAKIFHLNSFKVVFIGLADIGKSLDRSQYGFYLLPSFLLRPVESEIKERGYFSFFASNLFKSRYNIEIGNYKRVFTSYQRVIDEVKPDVVLLDDHFSTKAFFYRSMNIPVITIQTMFPPLKQVAVPPFQFGYVPTASAFSRNTVNGFWKLNQLKRWLDTVWIEVLTRGNTNLAIMKRLCPTASLTVDKHRCFGIGFKEVPMITTAPQPLDFPFADRFSNIAYCSSNRDVPPLDIADNRLLSLLKKMELTKVDKPNSVLIYCSLGTVTYNSLPTCKKFFNHVIELAKSTPDREFILSVGQGFDVGQLSEGPSNVRVFQSVPQKELLPYVDLMLTHGGLNSIRECIDKEVPMLIYPLTKKWDQPGNAARAVFHGLALKGNIRTANAISIGKKIDEVLSNKAFFIDSLRTMKKYITASQPVEEENMLALIQKVVGSKRENQPTFQ